MSDAKDTMPAPGSMRERMIRAVGAVYDGSADPVETPNNWARASAAVDAMLEEMRSLEGGVTESNSYASGQWSRRNIEAFIDAIKDEEPGAGGEG